MESNRATAVLFNSLGIEAICKSAPSTGYSINCLWVTVLDDNRTNQTLRLENGRSDDRKRHESSIQSPTEHIFSTITKQIQSHPIKTIKLRVMGIISGKQARTHSNRHSTSYQPTNGRVKRGGLTCRRRSHSLMRTSFLYEILSGGGGKKVDGVQSKPLFYFINA